MNKLTILIFELFKNILKNIAIKSNNIEYTYEDILESSKIFAKKLNDYYPRRINIALVANNSTEWIVAFLGIVFSKHHLILFSPNLSNSKLYHILQVSKSSLLITDLTKEEIKYSKLTTVHTTLNIHDISVYTNKDEMFTRGALLYKSDYVEIEDNGITVFTPRQMSPIFLTYNEIVDTLKKLNNKNIYSSCTNYVAHQEFTYNYVLCLLLPFLFESTIAIPNRSSEQVTAYYLRYTLLEHQTETIILTGFQFELLWREYIEDKSEMLTEFLLDFKFNRLRRWRIKKALKQLFPDLTTLIILNSSISYEIETILKKIKYPYTITYGTVETCGIATYSTPKEFVKSSVGKRLDQSLAEKDGNIIYFKPAEDSNYQVCKLDDVGSINAETGDVFIESRKDEITKTEFGFTISRDVERILKSLPMVTDCVFTTYKGDLILLVNIDQQYADGKNMKLHDIYETLNQCKSQINNEVHSFEKISSVRVMLPDFKRDCYGRILREFYTI